MSAVKGQGKRQKWLTWAVAQNVEACLIAPFPAMKSGYVRVWAGDAQVGGHAVACEALNGPRPEGTQASHTCNNRACWNKHHLLWETPKQNIARRKTFIGAENPNCKVNKPIADEIRVLYASGDKTQEEIGAVFGLKRSQIGNIVRGEAWT